MPPCTNAACKPTGGFLHNESSKEVHFIISKNWNYSRGDIYYANMDPSVGSEQGGERPVVVLQNDKGNQHSPTLIIATLTSRVDKKRHLPTHVLLDQNPGLKVPSVVQLEQIFTIDKCRLQRFVGQTSAEEMKRIEAALKISLGLTPLFAKG